MKAPVTGTPRSACFPSLFCCGVMALEAPSPSPSPSWKQRPSPRQDLKLLRLDLDLPASRTVSIELILLLTHPHYGVLLRRGRKDQGKLLTPGAFSETSIHGVLSWFLMAGAGLLHLALAVHPPGLEPNLALVPQRRGGFGVRQDGVVQATHLGPSPAPLYTQPHAALGTRPSVFKARTELTL